MGHFLICVLILFSTSGLFQVRCNFHKSRTWHEEFLPTPGELRRVLYPNYKKCVAPLEKPEQVMKNVPPETKGGATEGIWSHMVSIYASEGGFELYNWALFKREVDSTSIIGLQMVGLTIFVFCLLIVFIVFTCCIPVMGCFLFTLCHLAWSLIFHREIRRICRRTLIIKEKIYIGLKSLIPRKDRLRSRKHFRLPFVLREYIEEEVPAELIVSDEDSEAEHSSDGFEDLLIRIKGREAKADTAKTLLHLMANAEKEMEIHSTPTEADHTVSHEKKKS